LPSACEDLLPVWIFNIRRCQNAVKCFRRRQKSRDAGAPSVMAAAAVTDGAMRGPRRNQIARRPREREFMVSVGDKNCWELT